MSTPGATYRRILTSFWTDPDIRRNVRAPDAKAVLLYLFTGPDSTLSGLYFQPLDYMAAHTGVPLERVQELMQSFEGRYLTYDHDTEEVFVHAAWKHNVGEEWRPKDNRTKALLRQVADTHSDRLVAALVAEYTEWEWPAEVTDRATSFPQPDPPNSGEGAPKGLPSRATALPRDSKGAKNTRGFEATHAHAHAVTHTHTDKTLPSSTSPVAEGNSKPTAEEKPKQNLTRTTDAELRQEALKGLGLGKYTSVPDVMAVNRELQELLHTIDRGNLLAALRGLAILRDAGECGLDQGRPYTPGVLIRFKKPVWYGKGEQRTERNLLDLAQEVARKSDDAGRRSSAGPTLVADVLGLDRGAA